MVFKKLSTMLAIAAAIAATPAYSCQLVCQITSGAWKPTAIGGLAGGDAKCAAEFTNFKWARSDSILMSLPNPMTWIYATAYTGPLGPANGYCDGWTDEASNYNRYTPAINPSVGYGNALFPVSGWAANSGTGGAVACSTATIHLICCNM